jgi:hypothetical protein
MLGSLFLFLLVQPLQLCNLFLCQHQSGPRATARLLLLLLLLLLA